MATSESGAARFQAAIDRIDAANRDDPHRDAVDGKEYGQQQIYARRMTEWLERIAPDAPEVVRLAARAQHIRRWEIPRDRYPKGRRGYRQWRKELGEFHAETAGRLLREAGYEQETIARVQSLLRKESLKLDPECQLLEDVACLVFLAYYFPDFAAQHKEEKMINIVRRTWEKMSQRGHDAALRIELPAGARRLIEKALKT